MLHYLLPYEAWEDGPLAVCSKLRDPAMRERFASLLACFAVPMEQVVVAWTATKANGGLQGCSVAELSARAGKSAAETLCDLLIEENLAVLCRLEGGQDEWIEPFLKHPKFMLGTDGIYFPDALVHPRVYGSTARILGPLVRERKLFSLEEAVRRMTGVPAERFGLVDRGVVREGAFADLVLFDPETVADRATYDNPHHFSTGIEHVLVNGVPIVTDGKPLEDLGPHWPGRALRFNS
jgi:N-acyl-D-amino-acid deacylase